MGRQEALQAMPSTYFLAWTCQIVIASCQHVALVRLPGSAVPRPALRAGALNGISVQVFQ